MYKKIMVPLDGSELAECVLPHVESIAKGCRAKDVIFIRVVELFVMPAVADVSFSEEEVKLHDSKTRVAAEKYLTQLLSRLQNTGMNLQSEVIVGRAAESLSDYAEKNDIDLIIIATHGRSGISRWMWGSVADRVLRSSCVPVLMVRAPGCIPGI